MKKIIKYILNHVPRPILQKMANWAAPVIGVAYVGRGVECPICGARYRKFIPYGYVKTRPNALCSRCLALERHRLLWLWLSCETDILQTAPKFLHIAPEVCLMRKFKKVYSGEKAENYITADLNSPLAKVKMDIQAIPFPENSFDVIFCNHILEHVDNDQLAMSEMQRVMRPGGWGVMLVPIDENREKTFEDDSITDPDERTRVFEQYDHCRIYGQDYTDRLRQAGFEVEEVDYIERYSPQERYRLGLTREVLYIVRKPGQI